MIATGGPDPERLFSVFLDLVRLSSEPRCEGEVCQFVQRFCADAGLVVHEDGAGAATGGECGNLVVRVPAGAFSLLPPVILNAHMDTVVPGKGVRPLDLEDRYMSSGETVLGADCKAGLAAILVAVETLLSEKAASRALELVFTVQEEPGLIGAKHLDRSLLDGHWGLVLDGSGPVGGIVSEAPGRYNLSFRVTGHAAHAGVEPEKGKSAIACAARAIASMRVGRLDERTTVNVGTISGGSAVNIVPDFVQVDAEVRSLDPEALEREKDFVLRCFTDACRESQCELALAEERSFVGYRVDRQGVPARLLAGAMQDCGIEPSFAASGGGSDANILNQAGFEMITMNIGLVNAHSKQEYILKRDLLDITRILMRLATLASEEKE